ncbi:MAG: TatD family hydrolase [Solirubrobacterales bacterium]
MTLQLPPIDAHAHVHLAVKPDDLQGLGAVVFAVTGERAEWQKAIARSDPMALWGIGCHPGLAEAVESFSADAFTEALQSADLVGEVGLDGRSPAPMPAQREAFRAILEAVHASPRPITVHSRSAAKQVLDELESCAQTGAVLHWWRGSAAETERAIELGCFFSLNGAEAAEPKVIDRLPPTNVLTETDYPHSQRSDRNATRPAAVDTIERALEQSWGVDRAGVREQLWRNLETLLRQTGCLDRVPLGIQREMLSQHPAVSDLQARTQSAGAFAGQVKEVLSDFVATYPGLDRAAATSQCRIASTALVERLLAAGLPARLTWVRGHRVTPTEASRVALAADRHVVVRTANGFVDVARRQFDPASEHPRIYESEAELAQDWIEIDDGPADGGVEDERWRTLTWSAAVDRAKGGASSRFSSHSERN